MVAEGLGTGEVAERLGVHRNTVAKWRRRFEIERVDGLVDEPRPGRPRTVTDAHVEEGSPGPWRARPRTRRTGRRGRWPPRSGSRSRRCTGSGARLGLQPQPRRDVQAQPPIRSSWPRSATSSGSTCDPPERAVVLCVDEKSRSRRWTARRRSCRCSRACLSARRTTTSATARKPVRRAGPQHRQGDRALHGRHRAIELEEVSRSDSIARSRPSSTSTSSSTTARRQDARDPGMAASRTAASCCTSAPTSSSSADPRRALVRRLPRGASARERTAGRSAQRRRRARSTTGTRTPDRSSVTKTADQSSITRATARGSSRSRHQPRDAGRRTW